MKNMNKWKPIGTFPRDGEFYIVYNGIDMEILNSPEGHQLGRWKKFDNRWFGQASSFPDPIYWTEKPEFPK
jgi:hypothetical protein